MSVQDHASSSMNESGTGEKIDTPLTQRRSPDVLRDLTVRRNKVGAETPEGRLLSTLIQQVRNYQKETDPTARANLEGLIGRSVYAIEIQRRTA